MKKISVNIITNLEGGLDAQLHYFGNQTIPHEDFEIIIVDQLWERRHESIEQLIKLLGLDVVYIEPRRQLQNMVNTIAMSRNEALTYSDAEYILFFDDYEIPADNLLYEHLQYLKENVAVVGQHIRLNKMDMFHPNLDDVQTPDHRNTDNTVKEIPYGWFWTNNASVPMGAMIAMNGVDERFNGARNDDYAAIGLPLTKMNTSIIYNPNALCYHIDHGDILESRATFKRLLDIPLGNFVYEYKGHVHNLAVFTNNAYHNGDPTLMENDQFTCWRDKWSIKRYRCKLCGIEGICDGLEVYNIKLKEDTYVAPVELFDLKTAREQFEKENRRYI